jgi:hypothetical protein
LVVRREVERRAPALREPTLRELVLREVDRRAPVLREPVLRARPDLDDDAVVLRFDAVLRERPDFDAAAVFRFEAVERDRDVFDALARDARFGWPVSCFWRSARSDLTDFVNLRASRLLVESARSRSFAMSRVPLPTSRPSALSAPCAVSNASSKRFIAASYSRWREPPVRFFGRLRVVDRDGLIPWLLWSVGVRGRDQRPSSNAPAQAR